MLDDFERTYLAVCKADKLYSIARHRLQEAIKNIKGKESGSLYDEIDRLMQEKEAAYRWLENAQDARVVWNRIEGEPFNRTQMVVKPMTEDEYAELMAMPVPEYFYESEEEATNIRQWDARRKPKIAEDSHASGG